MKEPLSLQISQLSQTESLDVEDAAESGETSFWNKLENFEFLSGLDSVFEGFNRRKLQQRKAVEEEKRKKREKDKEDSAGKPGGFVEKFLAGFSVGKADEAVILQTQVAGIAIADWAGSQMVGERGEEEEEGGGGEEEAAEEEGGGGGRGRVDKREEGGLEEGQKEGRRTKDEKDAG